MEQDKKLKKYALFKTNFKFQQYLEIFSDFNVRFNFAKLRLSPHNLHIETGRYGSKKPHARNDTVYYVNPMVC